MIQGGEAKSSVCSLAVFVFGCKRCGLMGHLFSCVSTMGSALEMGFLSLYGKGGLIGLGGSFRPGVCVGKRVFGGGRSCVLMLQRQKPSRPVANYTTHLYIQHFSFPFLILFLFLVLFFLFCCFILGYEWAGRGGEGGDTLYTWPVSGVRVVAVEGDEPGRACVQLLVLLIIPRY